jgi:uncharacterized membrane protein YkvA (DUF1232 family)
VKEHNKITPMEQRRDTRQRPHGALLAQLKAQAAKLKRNIFTLYLAARDPRTPWYAKAFAACVVGYALSPIDLIPDAIPILGYLDDVILVPLGIYLAMKLIPPEVWLDCHEKAALGGTLPRSWRAAFFIILLWLATLALLGFFYWRFL